MGREGELEGDNICPRCGLLMEWVEGIRGNHNVPPRNNLGRNPESTGTFQHGDHPTIHTPIREGNEGYNEHMGRDHPGTTERTDPDNHPTDDKRYKSVTLSPCSHKSVLPTIDETEIFPKSGKTVSEVWDELATRKAQNDTFTDYLAEHIAGVFL